MTAMIDKYSYRRRYFTGSEPHNNTPFFIRRSSTEDEVLNYRNWTGRSKRSVDRHDESLRNDALAIAFVKKHTSIPVPNVIATFEDRGCFYVIEEYIQNAIPAVHHQVPETAHPFILEQLTGYMDQLHALKSDNFKSFTGRPFLPSRLSSYKLLEDCEYPEKKDAYVLCHGDIGWHNLLVHPETFDIVCILDWEWAGFYPVEMEGQYWKRSGIACPKPSTDEHRDMDDLVDMLYRLSKSTPRDRTAVEGPSALIEVPEDEQPNDGITLSLPLPVESSSDVAILPSMGRHLTQDVHISGISMNTKLLEHTKTRVGKGLSEVAGRWNKENMIFRDWAGAVNPLPHGKDKPEAFVFDTVFQAELSAKIDPLFQELGARVAASTEHLRGLANHEFKISKLKDTGSATAEGESVDDKVAKLVRKSRGLADEAVGKMEMEKWEALKKFGHDVFLLAHAAEQHFPWYPRLVGAPISRYPRRGRLETNKEREAVENRLRDFMEDGSGGWKVEVTEMTAEEYTPPKWDKVKRVKD